MPRYDQTGPQGKGPKTGRMMGGCVTKQRQGMGPYYRFCKKGTVSLESLTKEELLQYKQVLLDQVANIETQLNKHE